MKHNYLFLLLVGLFSCFGGQDSLQDPPVNLGSEESFLLSTDYGLLLSWLEPIEGDIHLRSALYNGLRWTEPTTIAKGTNWFVNWADFPALISNGDKLFAHYLEMSGEHTYDYDVKYKISHDRGRSWSEPVRLHSDSVKGEHGFVSGIPYKDGFAVSWLDGRYTKEENPRMSLRGAIIDAQGAVTHDFELDSMTCDCCQTAMVMGDEQPLVFYRDRTIDEIRDIKWVSFSKAGPASPRSLHDDQWTINACPVNGPAVHSVGQTMAVAWYSGKEANYEVKLKVSQDGGKSFGDAIMVDGPNSLGRVDVKLFKDKIYLTYMSSNGNGGSLVLATYTYDGTLVAKLPLASVSIERGTGFPRTAIWNNQLHVTWRDVGEGRVRLLSIPLDDTTMSTSFHHAIN